MRVSIAALTMLLVAAVPAVPAFADEISGITVTTQGDHTTGDNYDASKGGWYVDAGADDISSTNTIGGNDFLRERPLNAGNGFTLDGGKYYNGGAYYAYTDIASGSFGIDTAANLAVFRITLFGNYEQDVGKSKDSGAFGSGTSYRIIIGGDASGENSFLLSFDGSKTELQSSTFTALGGQAWYDSNGEVDNTTSGDGTTGYGAEVIKTDGVVADTEYEVLTARIINVDGQPQIEIIWDYGLYNSQEKYGYKFDENDIALLVFEANRGAQDQSNYLWNDEWSGGQQGSVYNTGEIQNVYELDRLQWGFNPVPEPSTFALMGLMLGGTYVVRRRRRTHA